MDSFVPYNQIDHPAMPKSHLNTLLLILMVTLFASGVALILIKQIDTYHREQLYLAEQAALPVHKAPKAATSTITLSGTESWKTYKNEEYGFEFKYPTDWNLDQRFDGPYFTDKDGNDLVWVDLKCTDAHGIENPDIKVRSTKEVFTYGSNKIIENKVFYKKSTQPEILALRTDVIDYARPGMPDFCQGFAFKIQNQNINQQTLGYIFSTFKFTKSSVPLPAGEGNVKDWKTYKNEEYGFEIKYPNFFFIQKSNDPKVIFLAGSSAGYDSLSIVELSGADGYVYTNQVMGYECEYDLNKSIWKLIVPGSECPEKKNTQSGVVYFESAMGDGLSMVDRAYFPKKNRDLFLIVAFGAGADPNSCGEPSKCPESYSQLGMEDYNKFFSTFKFTK